VDRLTLFGLVAVSSMLVCYAFERRSTWFILGFAVSCALGSAYGFLQGAWPFGVVEAIWSYSSNHIGGETTVPVIVGGVGTHFQSSSRTLES
jgi:hypothetical protein